MTVPADQYRSARKQPASGRGAVRATTAGLGAALVLCSLTAAGGPATATAASRPAGQAHAAAKGGTVRAWGYNALGQLGNGTRKNSDNPVPVMLPKGTRITSVRAGCDFSLALTTSGRILAWGDNADGQLGNGSTTSTSTPVRVKLGKHTKVIAVRAGCDFSLALTSKGSVLAWGQGKEGQLGNGSRHAHTRPVLVKLPKGVKITAITAGSQYALALSRTGRLYAWGSNGTGELGNGKTADRDRPVKTRLPSGTRMKLVSAGSEFALAIARSGQLYAWGYNGNGQLGDGTTTSRHTPKKIRFVVSGPPVGRITSLFAGCYHSLALTSHGHVLAWGYNGDGQLGNDTTTDSHIPVKTDLPAGSHVKGISAGCVFSLARTASGLVLAWGYNGDGELGNGTTTNSDKPIDAGLPIGLAATGIGSGPVAFHALAIVRKLAQ
jgi:alpha-tubulin suppressor-like RCC1 family protein